jgi:hypothetical protein
MYAYHFMIHRATRHAHVSANYYIHQNNVSSSLYLCGLMENENRIYINFERGKGGFSKLYCMHAPVVYGVVCVGA